MKEENRFLLRLEKDLYTKIVELARDEKRSINSQIIIQLEKSLKQK